MMEGDPHSVDGAVQHAAAGMLQTAYDYVGHTEDVEILWIYASMENDWVTALPIYRVAGEIYKAHELPEKVQEQIPSDADLPQRALTEESSKLYEKLKSAGDPPTRMIIRYETASKEMNLDFTYDPIPRRKDDSWRDVANQWLARLRETGVDAA